MLVVLDPLLGSSLGGRRLKCSLSHFPWSGWVVSAGTLEKIKRGAVRSQGCTAVLDFFSHFIIGSVSEGLGILAFLGTLSKLNHANLFGFVWSKIRSYL
jgi:hypothetical protein